MKKITGMILACVMLMILSLCGCNYDVYDDDSAIVKSNASIFHESYSNSTIHVYNHSFKLFIGVKKIRLLTLAKDDEIKFVAKIDEGRFKVVVIEKSTNLVTLVGEGSGTFTINGLSGSFIVKMVGDGASGSVSVLL